MRDALVKVTPLPYAWAKGGAEVRTDQDGWATLTINPTINMPLTNERTRDVRPRARRGPVAARGQLDPPARAGHDPPLTPLGSRSTKRIQPRRLSQREAARLPLETAASAFHALQSFGSRSTACDVRTDRSRRVAAGTTLLGKRLPRLGRIRREAQRALRIARLECGRSGECEDAGDGQRGERRNDIHACARRRCGASACTVAAAASTIAGAVTRRELPVEVDRGREART